MRLFSTAFLEGGLIGKRYTCDGADTSPPLSWSGSPSTTQSFAILCEDPDAPGGTWRHWAAYDIPHGQVALVEGASGQSGLPFKQANNDFNRKGYGGPCPPRGDRAHHYRFRLLALSVAKLVVSKNPSCLDVEDAARGHVIAEAILTGIYRR